MSGDIVLPVHLGHSPDKTEYQGAEAIARAIGVSRRTIIRWKRAGAPIYDELWEWIASHEKRLYPQAEKD